MHDGGGEDDDGGVAQLDGCHTPNNRLTERHAVLVYCLLLWYWTSMLWSTDTCQNKVSVDQYHVTISRAQLDSSSRSSVFLKVSADHVLFFRLDRGLMSGQPLENRAGLFGKPVNAHPESNVNQIITFTSMQMFLLLSCVSCDYWNSKQKAKQYTENFGAKLQNSNQNSTFSCVSLIGLWTTRSRSYAFRLA